MRLLFAGHTLDIDRRELLFGTKPVSLEPRVFDLLTYLVANRDRVVSRDDVFAQVWSGRIVSDSALTTRIAAARRAIGDSGEDQKLIRTVPRKGFRFVGEVREEVDAPMLCTEMAAAEPAMTEALALPDKPSIAVLPFANSPDERPCPPAALSVDCKLRSCAQLRDAFSRSRQAGAPPSGATSKA